MFDAQCDKICISARIIEVSQFVPKVFERKKRISENGIISPVDIEQMRLTGASTRCCSYIFAVVVVPRIRRCTRKAGPRRRRRWRRAREAPWRMRIAPYTPRDRKHPPGTVTYSPRARLGASPHRDPGANRRSSSRCAKF